MSHAAQLELRLTPLTPIHVGAGEDFDPTGYVIDDGVLFHFDPAKVPLDAADRKSLLAAVNMRGDEAILAVQRFFHQRRDACAGVAHHVVPVAAGVAKQYESRIGQVAQREVGGGRVANRLEIERTSHHPHTGAAYLPGTSLKGAMRTAWLNQVNRGQGRMGDERAQDLEKRLLQGSFHTDPFRLLLVGDAQGPDVVSQVVFSTNHKKREVIRAGTEMVGRGPVARREVIAPAQLHAMSCHLRIGNLDRHVDQFTPNPAARIAGWDALAKACNAYYWPRLQSDLALLDERRLVSEDWLKGVTALMQALAPSLDAGHAMLLRVGRHSGAESVTLDGVRRIRIMKGPGQDPDWSDVGATTVWLAAEREGDRSDMMPFGWLLVTIGTDVPPGLQSWCDAQPKPRLGAVRARLQAAREAAREAAEKLTADKAAEIQRQAEAARAQAERDAQLQSLTEQGRLVEALRQRLLAHPGGKQPVSGQLYQELRKLISQAEAPAQAPDQPGWPVPDRKTLAEMLRTLVPQKIELGGKAKDIKQAAARLSGDA